MRKALYYSAMNSTNDWKNHVRCFAERFNVTVIISGQKEAEIPQLHYNHVARS